MDSNKHRSMNGSAGASINRDMMLNADSMTNTFIIIFKKIIII